MDEVSLIRSSYLLIRKDFGLEENMGFEKAEISIDWLRKVLEARLNHFLDHDFDGLLNALYRIDISESKVKEALGSTNSGEISSALAELIIEREKQKVMTRLKYSPE